MATGLPCDATVAVARTAECLGRAAYRSDGFACEPEPAAATKTTFTTSAQAASFAGVHVGQVGVPTGWPRSYTATGWNGLLLELS